MIAELAYGSLRIGLPLGCAALAALWFARIGIAHIALEGQIVWSTIAYVAFSGFCSPGTCLFLSCLLSCLVGGALVMGKEFFKLDQFMVGIGLLFFTQGISQVICKFVAGNPGYAQLRSTGLSDISIIATAFTAIAISCLVANYSRGIRVSRVVGDCREVAVNQGMNIIGWSLLNAFLGSILAAVTGMYLAEHSGSFTSTIAGNRGFLALALVSIAGGNAWKLGLSVALFAISQKAIGLLSSQAEVVEIATYAMAIALQIRRVRK